MVSQNYNNSLKHSNTDTKTMTVFGRIYIKEIIDPNTIYHRLVEDDNHHPKEHLFYNAVGGNSACMVFKICALHNDKIFIDPSIQFKPVLTYEDGQPVANQNLLEIKDSSYDENDGFNTVKCRINDVSSHHQGQKFRLLFTATFPLSITSAYTIPIEVRSKIVKSAKIALCSQQVVVSEHCKYFEERNAGNNNMKKPKFESNIQSNHVYFNSPLPLSEPLSKPTSNTIEHPSDDAVSVENLFNHSMIKLIDIKRKLTEYQIQDTTSQILVCELRKDTSAVIDDLELFHTQLVRFIETNDLSTASAAASASASVSDRAVKQCVRGVAGEDNDRYSEAMIYPLERQSAIVSLQSCYVSPAEQKQIELTYSIDDVDFSRLERLDSLVSTISINDYQQNHTHTHNHCNARPGLDRPCSLSTEEVISSLLSED